MYKLKYNNTIEEIPTLSVLKFKEQLLRGLCRDYEVTYPDGYKMKCEYLK